MGWEKLIVTMVIKLRLEQDVEQALWVLQTLQKLGINIDKVTQQLEDEGVEKKASSQRV